MSYVGLSKQIERRQTEMLIRAQGKMIQLHRPGARSRTNSGGYASQGAETVLPAVKRFMGAQGRSNFAEVADLGQGEKLKLYLLGPYGDDIEIGDWFIDPDSNKKYTVELVDYDRTVETKAHLTEIT